MQILKRQSLCPNDTKVYLGSRNKANNLPRRDLGLFLSEETYLPEEYGTF